MFDQATPSAGLLSGLREIAEDVTGSGLVAAWLKRAQLTKVAQLFADYCQQELAPEK